MSRRKKSVSHPVSPKVARFLTSLPPLPTKAELEKAAAERNRRYKSLLRALAVEHGYVRSPVTTNESATKAEKGETKPGRAADWIDMVCPGEKWRLLTGKDIHRQMVRAADRRNRRIVDDAKGRPVVLVKEPSYSSVLRELRERRRKTP